MQPLGGSKSVKMQTTKLIVNNMENRISESGVNFIVEIFNDELKGSFLVQQFGNVAVVTLSTLKDVKKCMIILDMLNYNAVLHNPCNDIIEVLFN